MVRNGQTMSFYHTTISDATKVTDLADLEEIEDCMRQDIFHSTLDWQTHEQLQAAAVEAWLIIRTERETLLY